jgi:hypothetical protein
MLEEGKELACRSIVNNHLAGQPPRSSHLGAVWVVIARTQVAKFNTKDWD